MAFNKKLLISLILPLIFRIQCIEKGILISLKNDDFWPSELITSSNGTKLGLITGIPYKIEPGFFDYFHQNMVILPTINQNQYLIKTSGNNNGKTIIFKRRCSRNVTTDRLEILMNYANISVQTKVSDILIEPSNDNDNYWTFDEISENLFNIVYSQYTTQCQPGFYGGHNEIGLWEYNYNNKCIVLAFIVNETPKVDVEAKFRFTPISEYVIEAVVYDIKYDTNLEELIKKFEKQQVTLVEKSTINNHSPAALEQTISNSLKITEEFSYDFHDSWSNFHSVNVDLGVSMTTKAGLPGLLSTEITASINTGYKYEHQSTKGWATKNITTKEETYSVSKTVKVPPYTSVKVFSYVNFIKNMPVNVKLVFRITASTSRENLKGELKNFKLDSNSVMSILNKRGINPKIKIVGQEKDAVLCELVGIITASFGVDSVFNVDEIKKN